MKRKLIELQIFGGACLVNLFDEKGKLPCMIDGTHTPGILLKSQDEKQMLSAQVHDDGPLITLYGNKDERRIQLGQRDDGFLIEFQNGTRSVRITDTSSR